MKPRTTSNIGPETDIAERHWRLDAVGPAVPSSEAGGATEPDAAPVTDQVNPSFGPTTTKIKPVEMLRQWTWSARTWLAARCAWLAGDSRHFEDALHRFAASLDAATLPAEVENNLVSVAGQLWPASRSELVPTAELAGICQDRRSAEDGSGGDPSPGRDRGRPIASHWVEVVPLEWGRAEFGYLHMVGFGQDRPARRRQRARRLKTLCALAACALESLNPGKERPGEVGSGSVRENLPAGHETRGAGESDCGVHHPSVLHDATFLNAILPFAMGQAQRHREPLSLLCVAIDRLHGIRVLVGPAAADGLVRFVGDAVVSLVRKSDIVARLDDDRIVAVLPRSADGDAFRIGEIICQRVAEMRWLLCDQPGMKITVSAGAATFPSSANNVLSLFEAADAALAQSQSQGRNQSVMAPCILDEAVLAQDALRGGDRT